MDLELKGKRALVAGSSRGLGYAIARVLALEGCRVAINGRNTESIQDAARKLQDETRAEIVTITGDVGQPEIPSLMVEQTVQAFGGLDLLVTNAGGPPSGKFEGFDDAVWQHAIELSLMSHVRLIKAALPYLRQSDCASVVTLTSYSIKQPIPNLILSNSIRAATVGLTKSLSLELGADGIRFNSVLPGWTMTERVHELMSYRAKVNGTSVEEETNRQAKDSALGRMGQPVELANATVFLLSPAASYITGVMLTVDGGIYKGTL
ncbi:MAG: 3-oxoacyl-ACP reductase [Chloroflexi bacterium RBG_19FT_COMBO_49_13]|nr:MAG: 3-oxoacyl-ACP reductase [Chloroflexi bacterium RBG_19FT_COMBO_49_13]